MHVGAFVIGLFVLLSTACRSDESWRSISAVRTESDKRKVGVLKAVSRISDIRFDSQGSDLVTKREEIRRVVSEIENSDDLVTFALLVRDLSRHCFDMDCFKESELRPVYENAYWIVVETLASAKEAKGPALERLRIESNLQDTEAGNWSRIVDGREFP